MSALALAGDVAFAADARPARSSARTPHSSTVATWSSPFSKLRPERLLDALADDLLLLEAGQREGVPAAADHAALAVGHEEGRVGRRVVVVEQLEEEREAALRAALALARKPLLRSSRSCAHRSWGR